MVATEVKLVYQANQEMVVLEEVAEEGQLIVVELTEEEMAVNLIR